MILPVNRKIAKQLKWHRTGDKIFGLYNGCFFNMGDSSIFSSPNYKFINASVGDLNEVQLTGITNDLHKNKSILKFAEPNVSDGYLFIKINEVWGTTKTKKVYKILDFIVELLKKYTVGFGADCLHCGSLEKTGFYNHSNTGVILCVQCFERTKASVNEQRYKLQLLQNNYLLGFMGSILFSIPAIIGWVLIAIFIGKIALGMVFLIAILGDIGYNKFKGKQTRLTPWIIILSNMMWILFANIAMVTILLYREGLTIGSALSGTFEFENARQILNNNTAISFILAFFVWIWLLLTFKKDNLEISPALKVA